MFVYIFFLQACTLHILFSNTIHYNYMCTYQINYIPFMALWLSLSFGFGFFNEVLTIGNAFISHAVLQLVSIHLLSSFCDLRL